jgi:hypothetical protein
MRALLGVDLPAGAAHGGAGGHSLCTARPASVLPGEHCKRQEGKVCLLCRVLPVPLTSLQLVKHRVSVSCVSCRIWTAVLYLFSMDNQRRITVDQASLACAASLYMRSLAFRGRVTLHNFCWRAAYCFTTTAECVAVQW